MNLYSKPTQKYHEYMRTQCTHKHAQAHVHTGKSLSCELYFQAGSKNLC